MHNMQQIHNGDNGTSHESRRLWWRKTSALNYLIDV